jgi:Mor family transcriptional regulator
MNYITCPHCDKRISSNRFLKAHQSRAGSVTSDAKSKAVRMNGKLGGRPQKLTPEQVTRLRSEFAKGAKVEELAAKYNVARSTVYGLCASRKAPKKQI